MNDLLQLTSAFLVTNGLLFTALGAAATDNDKLKTGLSAAGILVSGLWLLTTALALRDIGNPPSYANILVYVMPGLFISGWLFSIGIHIRNWRKTLKEES